MSFVSEGPWGPDPPSVRCPSYGNRESAMITGVLRRVLLVVAAIVGVALVGVGALALFEAVTCDGWACLLAGSLYGVAAVSFMVAVPFLFATLAVVRIVWPKRLAWLIRWPTLLVFVGAGALLVGVGILIGMEFGREFGRELVGGVLIGVGVIVLLVGIRLVVVGRKSLDLYT